MFFAFCTAGSFPQYIVAFVPCSYQFKNYIFVEIGLLHSQPFMNSHFHFLVTRNQPLTKCHFSSPDEWYVAYCAYCKCCHLSKNITLGYHRTYRLGNLTHWTSLHKRNQDMDSVHTLSVKVFAYTVYRIVCAWKQYICYTMQPDCLSLWTVLNASFLVLCSSLFQFNMTWWNKVKCELDATR